MRIRKALVAALIPFTVLGVAACGPTCDDDDCYEQEYDDDREYEDDDDDDEGEYDD